MFHVGVAPIGEEEGRKRSAMACPLPLSQKRRRNESVNILGS